MPPLPSMDAKVLICSYVALRIGRGVAYGMPPLPKLEILIVAGTLPLLRRGFLEICPALIVEFLVTARDVAGVRSLAGDDGLGRGDRVHHGEEVGCRAGEVEEPNLAPNVSFRVSQCDGRVDIGDELLGFLGEFAHRVGPGR